MPVIIRQVTDQERLELALIENVQRSDLTPLETAEAYFQLSEEFGMAHDEIALRVGKSRVSVTNTLRLLKLAEPVRTALAEGKITEGHARALLGLTKCSAQAAAVEIVISRDLTVRQTEEYVRKLSGVRPPALAPRLVPPEVTALEEQLRNSLGTRVTLRKGKNGGSLTIHFFSDEEMDNRTSQILKGIRTAYSLSWSDFRFLDPAQPLASALAIEGDRIVAVGSDDEVLTLANRRSPQQDLNGKTVWPGLTDAHIHLDHYSQGLSFIDCETATRQECLQCVAGKSQAY